LTELDIEEGESLESTRMWARRRRKRTMYGNMALRKKSWFQVRI
jgi:hypothetical protein